MDLHLMLWSTDTGTTFLESKIYNLQVVFQAILAKINYYSIFSLNFDLLDLLVLQYLGKKFTWKHFFIVTVYVYFRTSCSKNY